MSSKNKKLSKNKTLSNKEAIIKEVKKIDDKKEWDKYVIIFENPKYNFLFSMSNKPICCEVFYLSSIPNENNLDKFKGAKINDINIEINRDFGKYKDENNINITIKTSVGDFIMVASNEHNGYYPHDCYINWNIPLNGIMNKKDEYIKL